MTKLLNLWRLITFRWINSDKTNSKDYLLVRCINETSDSVPEAMGITVERCKEIVDICIKNFESTSKFTDSMNLTSKECKHANELVYATYIMCDIKAQLNNPLERLFNMMHSRPKKD